MIMKSLRRMLWTGLLAVGGVVCSVSVSEKEPAAGDNEVASVLDSLEAKLGWIDYRLGLERWRRLEGGRSDSLDFFRRLRHELVADAEVYNALRGRRSQLADDLARRRYDLAYPEVVRAQIDAGRSIRGLYDSLSEFLSHRWCQVGGDRYSPDQVRAIVATSRSRAGREAAWRALSDPGEALEQQMARLFRLRNQATRRLGYNDYLSLSLDLENVEGSEYLDWLEAIDSVTRGPFFGMAEQLQTSLGADRLEVYDWNQRFARTVAEGDRLFPADSQKIFLKRFAAGLGFSLDKLPVYWREAAPGSGSSATATLVLVPSNDIRIVTDLNDGLESFRHLVQAFGRAASTSLCSQTSDLLARRVDPAWKYGIEVLFEALALRTAWVRSVTDCTLELETRLTRAEQAKRLMRLRLLLVEARFEYEAYRNPGQNLKARYWDIFEEYTGMPRHDELAPWAGRETFVKQPLAAYQLLLGECAAAQNFDYLRTHYDRLVDNPDIGSFLTHNYFRFGARYDWRELVERATERRLTPDFLASP